MNFWKFYLVLMLFFCPIQLFAGEAPSYSKVEPKSVDLSPVWQAWDLVQKEFVDPKSLEDRKMIIGMIKGLLSGTGDTHSVFFTKGEFDKFLEARKDGSVEAEVFKIKSRRGKRLNLGYLKIKGFFEKTHEEVLEAADEFKKNDVSAIILDLRKNTGGRLSSARGVCGAFIGPDKLILEKTGRKGAIQVFSLGERVFNGLPMVCLVNHYSASASEVVAGALRDHLGTKLIGVKTYGKGSIQENKEIDIGTILITTYHWTTPKGFVVNGHGLDPDFHVENGEDGNRYKNDSQLDRGIRVLLGED